MISKLNAVQSEKFSARGNNYELTIYKSQDSDEIKVNVSKNEDGQDILWTLQDLEIPAEIKGENELIEKCLLMAKAAIKKNESEN
nr:hypothetical protein [Desulfobulbaceae bacterium]